MKKCERVKELSWSRSEENWIHSELHSSSGVEFGGLQERMMMQRKCSSILRQKSWVKDWATELWGKKRRGMATRRESRQRWVALWGNGDYGRLGLASSKSVWEPTLCTSLQHTQPVAVACGGAHTLVLTGLSLPLYLFLVCSMLWLWEFCFFPLDDASSKSAELRSYLCICRKVKYTITFWFRTAVDHHAVSILII